MSHPQVLRGRCRSLVSWASFIYSQTLIEPLHCTRHSCGCSRYHSIEKEPSLCLRGVTNSNEQSDAGCKGNNRVPWACAVGGFVRPWGLSPAAEKLMCKLKDEYMEMPTLKRRNFQAEGTYFHGQIWKRTLTLCCTHCLPSTYPKCCVYINLFNHCSESSQ